MAQYPALPLFTDAFIADTTHLTAAQVGAYILLLMVAWRTPECCLFDDDALLARYARMDKRTWNANKATIMQFWHKDELGRWYQKRLKDERSYVEDLSRKNSGAAHTRWNRHKTKTGDIACKNVDDLNNNSPANSESNLLNNNKSGYANAMPNGCQTDAPTPTIVVTEAKASRADARQEPVNNSPQPDERIDFKKIIFSAGLKLVMKETGKPEDGVRKILGKWCSVYGDAPTATAIMQAQQFNAVDPIAYIENFLKEKKHETTKRDVTASSRNNKSERAKTAIRTATDEILGFTQRPSGERET